MDDRKSYIRLTKPYDDEQLAAEIELQVTDRHELEFTFDSSWHPIHIKCSCGETFRIEGPL